MPLPPTPAPTGASSSSDTGRGDGRGGTGSGGEGDSHAGSASGAGIGDEESGDPYPDPLATGTTIAPGRGEAKPFLLSQPQSKYVVPVGRSSTPKTPPETNAAHAYDVGVAPPCSFWDVFDLMFRLVYSWNLFSGVLAGFAISCSFVIQACFVVARGVFDDWYYSEAIAATLWLPFVNVLTSWLIDEAVDLLADTVSASAWEGIWGLPGGSTTVHNRRAQFVYLTNGNGTRPSMLRFRAMLAAVLAALLVPTQDAPDFEETKVVTKGKNEAEPLFRIPTAIALVVDLIFILGLLIFPLVYMVWARFGENRYSSYLSSLSTILFLIGLTMPCIYAVLHLIVFCWPRAACLFAFTCGEDVAEVIFAPYALPLMNRAVIAAPVSCGFCCSWCVGCIERPDDEYAHGLTHRNDSNDKSRVCRARGCFYWSALCLNLNFKKYAGLGWAGLWSSMNTYPSFLLSMKIYIIITLIITLFLDFFF